MGFESKFLSLMNENNYTKLFAKYEFPLQRALEIGSPDEVLEILSRKFVVKSTEKDWVHKCREIVDICLDQKLYVNVLFSKYSGLLHFVIKYLYNDFESVLLRCERESLDINALNDNSMRGPPRHVSLLHFAIEKGRKNVVKALLEFGADVNVQGEWNQTPLFYAVSTAQVDIAEMLLKAGANVHAMDERQMMPINVVFCENEIRNGYFNFHKKSHQSDLINLLGKYGADMNFQNARGTSTLLSACRRGDFNDVQFLLKHGADLLSRSERGNSVLHSAALGNNYNLIEFLLRSGVDINAKNGNNESPIHSLSNTIDVIHFELEYLEEETSVFVSTVWNLEFEAEELQKSADMIEFLADNGADVNTFSDANLTPLMLAVQLNSLEIVDCLLELTADVTIQKGSTYYFSEYRWVQPNADFFADRINPWVLMTAFLALTKNCDISQFCGANTTDFQWVHPFFEECKTEVNQMKKRNICENRNVTFFDFLTEDLMDVLQFCRSEDIVTVLESGKHKEEFPRYRYLFDKRMERVQKLKNCKTAFVQFLKKYFKKSLPAVVLDEIMSYLTPGNLRNFGRAVCVSEKYPGGNYYLK